MSTGRGKKQPINTEIERMFNETLVAAKLVRLKRLEILELEALREELGEEFSKSARLLTLRDEYKRDVARLLVRKHDAAALLAKVAEPEKRLVMEARYILGMKWEAVAEMTNYSDVHVYRLAKDCVRELADKA